MYISYSSTWSFYDVPNNINYNFINGNGTFKRTFQLHLDPDRIKTIVDPVQHNAIALLFLWKSLVSIYNINYNVLVN